ncbi:SGNH hydrolase-type esterase domain-containing protein [Artemisia annua]|uniref:SGNH hydrolase-type esterase domain-containing protein n=1 Tax=Artemisia annua TaxID=35608 RepID=A0A2U1LLN0_ARTAN|nr:SGNH hydrolase-type esterase domain-containing protein [Artemisia annua]
MSVFPTVEDSRNSNFNKNETSALAPQPSQLDPPIKYNVLTAKFSQVEPQDSIEMENSPLLSEEDQPSVERSFALIRSTTPKRGKVVFQRDAGNSSDKEDPEKPSKNDVLRMRVKDKISLFESKQIDQNKSSNGSQASISKASSPYVQRDPFPVVIGSSDLKANHSIHQHVDIMTENQKYNKLVKLLDDIMDGNRILIFMDTKKCCDQITRQFRMDNWLALSIHGDKIQAESDFFSLVSIPKSYIHLYYRLQNVYVWQIFGAPKILQHKKSISQLTTLQVKRRFQRTSSKLLLGTGQTDPTQIGQVKDTGQTGHPTQKTRVRRVVGKPQVPCYFIFGDSLVDSGNNNGLITFSKTDYPFMEWISQKVLPAGQLLGFEKFIPPHTTATDGQINIGVNYASGSSGIREETGIHLVVTIFTTKFAIILDMLFVITVNTNVRITIWNNDYINNYFLSDKYNTSRIYTTDQYASVLIQQLSQQLRFYTLQTLYNLGARKIDVHGVFKVGCIPIVVDTFDTDGKPCVEPINDAAKLYNDRLKPLVDELNTNYPDARFTFINMTRISSLQEADMSLSTTPCCQLNEGYVCIPYSIPCPDRTMSIYFDGYHFTEIVTTSIATRSYNALSPLDASPYDISDLVRLHDTNYYADI